MLISVVLVLISDIDREFPVALGRANYAAALRAIGAVDAALARQTHDGDGPKPLTCSGILDAQRRRDALQIVAQQPYTVRLTGLTADMSAALASALVERPPDVWELERCRFAVTDIICDPARHPWTGSIDYETLAAKNLARSSPSPQLTLNFAAPTAFKSGGLTVAMPTPNLVFGSLVERWNAFSRVPLAPELRQFGSEGVAVSRYRLETQAVGQKNAALRIGCVGQATYRVLSSDRERCCLMQLLGDFALYAGVGVQTTTGMGQVRRLEQGKQEWVG